MIGALGEYLTNIRNLIYYDSKINKSRLYLVWWTGSLANQADNLKSRMLRDGWCESEVRRIYYHFSLSVRYFINNLDRPGPDTDHQVNCNRFKCVAYKTDKETYRTEHVKERCDCKHIFADQQHIVSILKRGTIPLVSTARSFEEEMPLEVIQATSGTKYVATSHVWSDGLGNPLANSLIRCQLVHIAQLVNQLYEPSGQPVSFWMDTLCCPTGPEIAARLAIQQMRKTYSEADIVLVSEKYFRSHSAEPMSALERMTRILFQLNAAAMDIPGGCPGKTFVHPVCRYVSRVL